MVASLNVIIFILSCYACALVQGLLAVRVAVLPSELNRHQSYRRSRPRSSTAVVVASRQARKVSPLGATSGAQTPSNSRTNEGSEGVTSSGFGSRASRRRKGILDCSSELSLVWLCLCMTGIESCRGPPLSCGVNTYVVGARSTLFCCGSPDHV